MLDRRCFVRGTGVALAGMATVGVSTALAEGSQASTGAQDGSQQAEQAIDCDIVIIGAGGSGLAAAVEAAEEGASVIVLERMSYSGGGELGVEGVFAVGSSMQQAEGIEISAGEMVRAELAASQQRAHGPAYVDMIHASGSDIDWLLEHGVTFQGVDADTGSIKLFHRFDGDSGGVGYVPPMEAAAKAAGASFMYECLADELVKDATGAVAGVLATDADGNRIQVNAAKGVIIATGGFAENFDLVAENGFNVENCNYVGMVGHDGIGHQMAVTAGAKSVRESTAYLASMSVMRAS